MIIRPFSKYLAIFKKLSICDYVFLNDEPFPRTSRNVIWCELVLKSSQLKDVSAYCLLKKLCSMCSFTLQPKVLLLKQ